MNAQTGGQTLAQKLVARAAGRASVTPGEIVTCRVDLAMMHDSGGPRRVKPMLEKLGAKVWDPEKVVVITDHYLPADDEDSKQIIATAREWVKDAGVKRFYDGIGICHVVLPEQGHLRPGMFVVGGDSHSPTGGAFGAYMIGIGATEMLGVLVTGEIWLKVPQTILLEWDGAFGDGVSAKDVMLFLCGRFGMDGGQYQAVQYGGAAIAGLGMQERMTLANMTAEFGGQAGLIAPDDVTREFLAAAGVAEVDVATWQTDDGAPLAAHHRFDAGALAPQVAAPHSPANSRAVEEYGEVRVDTAYIGACTARSSPICGWPRACCAAGASRAACGCSSRRRPSRIRRRRTPRARSPRCSTQAASSCRRVRRVRRLRRAPVRRGRGRDLLNHARFQGTHGRGIVRGSTCASP